MPITVPTYTDKVFIIEDNFAVIRNPNNLERSLRYKAGDNIPPNSAVGRSKILPLNTHVTISDVRMDDNRNVYVFAEPIDAPDFIPSGWTRPSNLQGRFLNEIICYRPKEWDLAPNGDNFTATDKKSLIRTGSPNYRSIGKIIPAGTYVEVTAKSRQAGKVGKYVRVRHISIEDGEMVPGEPIGWTSAGNLTPGNSKIFKEWDLAPNGDNFTAVDKKSLIRTGGPNYRSIRKIIPVGTYVEVTAKSTEAGKVGKYVEVRHMTIKNGKIVSGERIGWTSAGNLIPGSTRGSADDEWTDVKGGNAAWKSGRFIGAKVLVGIVGTGGQLQYIVWETLEPYLKLLEAAQEDNITLSINSGFRTYAKQKALRDGWEARKPGFNLAAKPGRSNHQNGIAFDLNTGGFNEKRFPVYRWMKKNATKFGFLRTVNGEHWHWEYRPKDAAIARRNKTFKLSRVRR